MTVGWIQRYRSDPSEANREALRDFLTPDAIRWQYTHGTTDESVVSPDGSALDAWHMACPEARNIQRDLFLDYASNIALYPDFQNYFRTYQPKLLAIWGRNDAFVLPPGAEAYRRDLPNADIRLLDTRHFALETMCPRSPTPLSAAGLRGDAYMTLVAHPQFEPPVKVCFWAEAQLSRVRSTMLR